MDLAKQMVTSVPEESKIENFGDYGTESSSAESSDEEDTTIAAATPESAKSEDKTTSETVKKETENA